MGTPETAKIFLDPSRSDNRGLSEAEAAGVENVEAFAVNMRGYMLNRLGQYEAAQDYLDRAAEMIQLAPSDVPLA